LKGWEWNRVILPIPGLPPAMDGFCFLHLTDLHFKNRWMAQHDELIDKVCSAALDMILITGDFVESKTNHLPALPHVKRLLGGLHSRLGTFGILGNHDGYLLSDRLAGQGVRLLNQERMMLETGRGPIELVALTGVTRRALKPSFLESIGQKTPGVPRIVLSHFPDSILKKPDLPADLYIAGHTHGGQICPPGGYPISRHDRLPRRHCSGLSRYNNTWMLVNRGFGFTSIPVRIFCPAEVVEVMMKRQGERVNG
jgi:predicted MPP superfamily phosphohydrolase